LYLSCVCSLPGGENSSNNRSILAAEPGGMAVKLERTYHSVADPDTEVAPDERVKGYKYGKTLVCLPPPQTASCLTETG